MRRVPASIAKPSYWQSGQPAAQMPYIALKDADGIAALRRAGQLARDVLDYACSIAGEGVSTDEVDRAVHDRIVASGAYPTPLNYMGFPKSVCSSVNEVACHGIPDDRKLRRGDVVSFDVSLYIGGHHGDNCATVIVGEDDAGEEGEAETHEARALCDATQRALDAAIAVVRPGGRLNEIGEAIEDVASEGGYGIVEQFCGHGIGTELHEMPLVLHTRNDNALRLQKNMVFTIEPILTMGAGAVYTWDDGWTAATTDGAVCAQYEHMVLVTDSGAEVLTVPSSA